MDFYLYLSSNTIEYRSIDIAHQVHTMLYHFAKSELIELYSAIVYFCLKAPFFPRYMFIHATRKQMISMLHFIIAYDFQISPNCNFRLDISSVKHRSFVECIEIDWHEF